MKLPRAFTIERRIDPGFFFFFNDTATTEIYTLSLHDALPISVPMPWAAPPKIWPSTTIGLTSLPPSDGSRRSEEHTSELQSQSNLVCRLLLEKKKKKLSSRPSRNMVWTCGHDH